MRTIQAVNECGAGNFGLGAPAATGDRPRHRRAEASDRPPAHRAGHQRPRPARRRARPGQDALAQDARRRRQPQVPAAAVHAGHAARRHRRHDDLQSAATAASTPSTARSSPISFWPTKSTAPRPRCRARCSKPCRSARSRSATRPTSCPIRSWCWPRRTRSSRKAPIRCPKRRWTASC